MLKKILVLLSMFLITGCSSWKSSSILSDDTINHKAGFNAVVIMRLKLIDETNTFETLGNLSMWEGYTGETPNENRMAQLILGTEGRWKTENGESFLEKTVFMETISGPHTLHSLSFSYDTLDHTRMRRTTHTITMPIKRDFMIPENSICYLGELEIKNRPGGVFDQRFVYNEKQKDFSILAFSKLFPEVFNQYKETITIVQPTHTSQ